HAIEFTEDPCGRQVFGGDDRTIVRRECHGFGSGGLLTRAGAEYQAGPVDRPGHFDGSPQALAGGQGITTGRGGGATGLGQHRDFLPLLGAGEYESGIGLRPLRPPERIALGVGHREPQRLLARAHGCEEPVELFHRGRLPLRIHHCQRAELVRQPQLVRLGLRKYLLYRLWCRVDVHLLLSRVAGTTSPEQQGPHQRQRREHTPKSVAARQPVCLGQLLGLEESVGLEHRASGQLRRLPAHRGPCFWWAAEACSFPASCSSCTSCSSCSLCSSCTGSPAPARMLRRRRIIQTASTIRARATMVTMSTTGPDSRLPRCCNQSCTLTGTSCGMVTKPLVAQNNTPTPISSRPVTTEVVCHCRPRKVKLRPRNAR